MDNTLQQTTNTQNNNQNIKSEQLYRNAVSTLFTGFSIGSRECITENALQYRQFCIYIIHKVKRKVDLIQDGIKMIITFLNNQNIE